MTELVRVQADALRTTVERAFAALGTSPSVAEAVAL